MKSWTIALLTQVVCEFSGMSVFAWLSWHVQIDHGKFLNGQIIVCLGFQYLCVAAGGLSSESGWDQRGSTCKYFCRVRGHSYWTWVTTSIPKQKTLSVMREMFTGTKEHVVFLWLFQIKQNRKLFYHFDSLRTYTGYWKCLFFMKFHHPMS